ncbi:MAG: hypothetical protein R6V35_05115 [Candidatus Nanohaloarchaea archaeon]
MSEGLREEVVDAKNHFEREFNYLTSNFYIMKACLRYFTVKKGMSFTSSKVSDNFPISIPVAGSSLKVLDELDVIESRGSKPERYMPQKVDLEKMLEIEKILLESKEIREFQG